MTKKNKVNKFRKYFFTGLVILFALIIHPFFGFILGVGMILEATTKNVK